MSKKEQKINKKEKSSSKKSEDAKKKEKKEAKKKRQRKAQEDDVDDVVDVVGVLNETATNKRPRHDNTNGDDTTTTTTTTMPTMPRKKNSNVEVETATHAAAVETRDRREEANSSSSPCESLKKPNESSGKDKKKKSKKDKKKKKDKQESEEKEESTFGKGDNDEDGDDEIIMEELAARPIVESSAVFKKDDFLVEIGDNKNKNNNNNDIVDDETHDNKNRNNKKNKNNNDDNADDADDRTTTTLLLFYQYVEPPWSESEYKQAKQHVEFLGQQAGITGRMRVAKEGLNCTLTSFRSNILNFCRSLRRWKPQHFLGTEFKLTHDLPLSQAFPAPLKIIPVVELVHYGLEGPKAPPIALYHGTHLEPKDYHSKLAEPNTVVIDVRNHYEAIIGRFDPPPGTAEWIDPKMRKSTEFPVWLDAEETKQKMKGKQVLMYCTGGIRCERASALLQYKMKHDPAVQELGIQGVYQLQGGIDKYFKEFPDGGFWKGKNYTFDKRCAHAPPAKEGETDSKSAAATTTTTTLVPLPEDHHHHHQPMGRCEACNKAWDKYRGKRRCPTCGVPSLTCKECWQADANGIRKLGKSVRCDLCVEQGITNKHQLRQQEEYAIAEYEQKMKQLQLLHPPQLLLLPNNETLEPVTTTMNTTMKTTETTTTTPAAATTTAMVPSVLLSSNNITNPGNVTKLAVKNMCKKNMNEQILMEFLPGITHIVWKVDHRNNKAFLGQGWIEMESPEAAARAVAKSGQLCLGRPLYVHYQPPNPKDTWPPPNSAVVL